MAKDVPVFASNTQSSGKNPKSTAADNDKIRA